MAYSRTISFATVVVPSERLGLAAVPTELLNTSTAKPLLLPALSLNSWIASWLKLGALVHVIVTVSAAVDFALRQAHMPDLLGNDPPSADDTNMGVQVLPWVSAIVGVALVESQLTH